MNDINFYKMQANRYFKEYFDPDIINDLKIIHNSEIKNYPIPSSSLLVIMNPKDEKIEIDLQFCHSIIYFDIPDPDVLPSLSNVKLIRNDGLNRKNYIEKIVYFFTS